MDYLHDDDDDDDDNAVFEALLREIAAVGDLLHPRLTMPVAAAANQLQPAAPDAGMFVDMVMEDDGNYCAGARCACAEWTYDADLYDSLREMEMDAGERPAPDYLTAVQRGQIDPNTRSSLVAWLDGITREHGLVAGTLHRAVTYVDRYLSARPLEAVSGRLLALLCVTAVFVAAKYESDFSAQMLTAAEAARAGGCGLDRSEVIDKEHDLLDALGYRLGCPTAHTFADHFLARYGYPDGGSMSALAHHLADLTLLDYRSLRFPPSVVAASAVHLARCAVTTGLPPLWGDDGLEAVTGYSAMDLARCMGEMYDVHEMGWSWPWPGYQEMRDRFPMDHLLLPRRIVVPLSNHL